MFNKLARNAENLGWTLGSMLVVLILLFGVMHFASKYTPSPISSVINKAADLATPGGWSSNS